MTIKGMYTVSVDGVFVMTCTAETLRLAFKLSDPAMTRVWREAGEVDGCVLHFNGRPSFLGNTVTSVLVTEAV